MKISHAKLTQMLSAYDKSRKTLMIKGKPGIGKSFAVREYALRQAEAEKRRFFDWAAATPDERAQYTDSREFRDQTFLYSVFDLLVRMPEDMSGIPDMSHEYMTWKPDVQLYSLTLDGARGLVFMDELQQAQTDVQKTVARIFNDREVACRRISDDIVFVAASNSAQDKCGVYDMLEHLKNRLGHVELQPPSVTDWTRWAMDHAIDSRITGFHMYKGEGDQRLYEDMERRKSDAFATPRSWVSASSLIAGIDDRDLLHDLVATQVGEACAFEFKAFIDVLHQNDFREFVDQPEKIAKAPLDIRTAFFVWLIGHHKDQGIGLDRAIELVYHATRDDMGWLVLSGLKSANPKISFAKEYFLKPEFSWILKRFGKYFKG